MSITTTLLLAVFAAIGDNRFVNFESPQVHPLTVSPSGEILAVCNTANGTVDIFTHDKGLPVFAFSVPVGLDPVSARFRTDNELWVANWLSDSVSIIDLSQGNIVRTLQTEDEPADIAFTSNGKAVISCSMQDLLLVFDTAQLDAPPTVVRLRGKFPRALAVSEDGKRVFVGIFQSGNRTTLIAEDFVPELEPIIPGRAVSRPDGPHGGQNPPFNGDGVFVPPLAAGLPPPPAADLIVRQDDTGIWRDDTGADWTKFISGEESKVTGRVPGWHLADHDVAVLDAETMEVSYIKGLMNICMALAVRPGTGEITVVGTDATNEIRYEPNVAGRMVKSIFALAAPGAQPVRADLNAAVIDYTSPRTTADRRALAIGEPRAVVWNAAGARAWVAGRGSNNITQINADGTRGAGPVRVGAGPSGLVLDEANGKLHVLCQFGASLETIELSTFAVAQRVALYDPTPSAIRAGRPVLYDTVATSGHGQAACASCHVDARTDGLAWDLGDPQGATKSSADRNKIFEVDPSPADTYHPMKGPRTTQTLQDIIGHEPFHWSGDRDGLEAFSDAFKNLNGGDDPLGAEDMAKLKAFLSTIGHPPNPYRNLDNSLSEAIDLSWMLGPAAPGEARAPLPSGNARRGFDVFMMKTTDCSRCHSVPTGRGSHLHTDGGVFRSSPHGPNNEAKLRAVVGANTRNQSVRMPAPLAGFYTKLGMDYLSPDASTLGFGFFSAGAFDSGLRFAIVIADKIGNLNYQDCVDLFAFVLSWGGSDFPAAPSGEQHQLPGLPGRDSHAALGAQTTLPGDDAARSRLDALVRAVEASPRIELIATGIRDGAKRGWWLHDGKFQSDTVGDGVDLDDLVAESRPDNETTFTVVARGTGKRLGIDRDLDGVLNSVDRNLDPVALDASIRDADLTSCAECEPSGLQLAEGDTLCLAVDAPGASGFLWSLRNRVFSDFDRVRGATTGRFQLAALTDSDRGMYRVDYIDAAGAPANQFFVVTVAPKGRVWPWIALAGTAAVAFAMLLRRRYKRAGS